MSASAGTIKRLVELGRAFPGLTPEQLLREWNLPIRPEELATLWETPGWTAYQNRRAAARLELRSRCVPDHPGLRLWRERQENRCLSQLGQQRHEVVLHYPAAFELSQGCSVGCWFCGFAAPRLSANWPGHPENLQLWKQMLESFRALVGEAAGQAFCYWATDPLDHPDYEAFCRVFQTTLGAWPRTTTALASRNPERTRALLSQASQHGSLWDRFSVLSLADLRKLYRQFDPDELVEVELVIQSAEELVRSTAGRARQAVESGRVRGRVFPDGDGLAGTIACVSGFLINLVAGSVRLISPCHASEEFPLGFRVFGQENFQGADEFALALQRLSSSQVLECLPDPERPLRWRADLQVGEEQLLSPHLRHVVRVECLPAAWRADFEGKLDVPRHAALQGESAAALSALWGRLQGEGTSLAEAMLALHVGFDQDHALTRNRILSLWQAGLLAD